MATTESEHEVKKCRLLEESRRFSAEEVAQASKAKLNTVLNAINDAFYIFDDQWRFSYLNRQAERYWNRPREELLGKVVWEEYPEVIGTIFDEKYHWAIEKGEPIHFVAFSPATGKWCEVYAYPSPEGLNIILRDITDKKQQEEEFRRVIESITDIFSTLDREWRFVYFNQEAERISGKTLEEVKGRVVWEVFPLLRGTKIEANYYRAVQERVPVIFESYWPKLDSYFEISAYPWDEGLTVCIRDITDKKKHQEKIAELAAVVEHSNDAIITVNTEFIIITWNKTAESIYGYAAAEVIGQSVEILMPPDRKNDISHLYRSALNGKNIANYETARLDKSGKTVNVSLSVFPLRDEAGAIYGFSTIARDITRLKRYEEEMAKMERLNLIGQMSASLAHEVRNPLTTVKGFLQLLATDETNDTKREYFNLMVEEIDRAAGIINEFLALARDKAITRERLNLNFLVRHLVPLLQASAFAMKQTITVDLTEIPDLDLDGKEIRQLLLNLVRNGLEAMPAGGELVIRTYWQNGEVGLEVQDQGQGIPLDILPNIGNPFVTSKDKGTGLGLAVCYSIADRHQARVDLLTGPGGTTFTVWFKPKTDLVPAGPELLGENQQLNDLSKPAEITGPGNYRYRQVGPQIYQSCLEAHPAGDFRDGANHLGSALIQADQNLLDPAPNQEEIA